MTDSSVQSKDGYILCQPILLHIFLLMLRNLFSVGVIGTRK